MSTDAAVILNTYGLSSFGTLVLSMQSSISNIHIMQARHYLRIWMTLQGLRKPSLACWIMAWGGEVGARRWLVACMARGNSVEYSPKVPLQCC